MAYGLRSKRQCEKGDRIYYLATQKPADLIGVLSNAERHAQMQEALLKFPFIEKRSDFTDDTLSIVGFGPSLRDTWKSINLSRPIISTSGAHDFLIEHGITPDWHVHIDPLPCMVKHLTPHPHVKYLMASVCHPDFWELLRGYDVKLWHMVNDEETVKWVAEHHPAGMSCLIGGGSTVGQRAMNIGAALGYRKFDVYGMDGSFIKDRHAGPHTGSKQVPILVKVGGRVFKTTPQLRQSAKELEEFLRTMDVEITFHGDGLIQEIAQTIKKRKARL
jgi:hypothetical protein